jgi:hypothetical protein
MAADDVGEGLLIRSKDEILIPTYFYSVPVSEITQPASNLLATPPASCYRTHSFLGGTGGNDWALFSALAHKEV